MTPDQIYQLLLGLVTLFGGIWIRRLQSISATWKKPLSVSERIPAPGRCPRDYS
jgi:hypothetical protein